MEDRTWIFTDRRKWAPGPWLDEPDKEQWTDAATGFACLLLRDEELGSLCGYVGVPEGHPWHGRSCWDIPTGLPRDLTYSNECEGDPEHATICHAAAPGDPDPLWWLGFHCASASDLSPAFLGTPGPLPQRLRDMLTYRSADYVRELCAQLAGEAQSAASV